MCHSTPINVDFASTDENLFGSLERMIRGCPLPHNVINYVNPYNYVPSNLPDGIWYLVCSKENTNVQHGQWRAKEETCEIFSNSSIIGWRTTLEFYEGQVPLDRKTDWVMQEFRITHKRLHEGEKEEDSRTLCRVFLSGKKSPNHELQQEMFSANITSETFGHSMQLSIEKSEDGTRQGSTSRREVNDDNETRTSAVVEGLTNHREDNLPEADYFSEDDFLELLDLDQPLSPSSSSDNSSCMTLLSDEYVDQDALLQELEVKKTEGPAPENPGHKYSFSTSYTPSKVVMLPGGSHINVERSKLESKKPIKSGCSIPESNHGDEGSSLNSRKLKSLPIAGRMKKLKRKYFCFMPF